jgi:hypothetical protein
MFESFVRGIRGTHAMVYSTSVERILHLACDVTQWDLGKPFPISWLVMNSTGQPLRTFSHHHIVSSDIYGRG